MLHELRVANFKSFQDSGQVELSPLTVIVGANSSGKSSIIQAILLAAQTFQENLVAPLLLNGPLVRLGTLSDIAHCGASQPLLIEFSVSGATNTNTDERAFRYRFGPNLNVGRITISAEIIADSTSERGVLIRSSQIKWTYPPQVHGSERTVGKVALLQATLGTTELPNDVPTEEIEQFRDALRYKVKKENIRISRLGPSMLGSVHGVYFDGLCPGTVVIKENISDETKQALWWTFVSSPGNTRHVGSVRIPEQLGVAVAKSLQKIFTNPPSHFGTTQEFNKWYQKSSKGRVRKIKPLLRKTFEDWTKTSEAEKPEYHLRQADIIPEIRYLIKKAFSSIKYLGPLRVDPQVVYSHSTSSGLPGVGLKGEFTAAVFSSRANDLVKFWNPTSEEMQTKPLKYAVDSWIRYFGVAEGISPRDYNRVGASMEVESPWMEQRLDLTSVGVGVSQVLPVLVTALLSSPDDVLVFEQPELHLHPKVQGDLADFFLSIARLGKQCIIETHSEYLVNRLRLRKAEASPSEEEAIEKTFSLIFVEQESGRSSVQNVRVNKYGAIPRWPQGFFDQGPTEADRIAEAAFRKRHQEKKLSSQ